MLRKPAMRHPNLLLSAACSAGLSCSLLPAPTLLPAAHAQPLLAQATTVHGTLQDLAGTRLAATKKNSPFAGAKERDDEAHSDLKADRGRLWWLLLPVGLAAISYGALRSQEDDAG